MGYYRNCFNRIIVGFSDHHTGTSFEEVLVKKLSDIGCVFIRSDPALGDWRNDVVNRCLSAVKSDRVLFMEQDFIIKNWSMMGDIIIQDFGGFKENGRIHPAFLSVKRDLIEQTSKNFSANPPAHDHFGHFTSELEKLTTFETLESHGRTSPEHWEHLAGLTHNYYLVSIGQKVTFKKERFRDYNEGIIKCGFDIVPGFRDIIYESAR